MNARLPAGVMVVQAIVQTTLQSTVLSKVKVANHTNPFIRLETLHFRAHSTIQPPIDALACRCAATVLHTVRMACACSTSTNQVGSSWQDDLEPVSILAYSSCTHKWVAVQHTCRLQVPHEPQKQLDDKIQMHPYATSSALCTAQLMHAQHPTPRLLCSCLAAASKHNKHLNSERRYVTRSLVPCCYRSCGARGRWR
jgi:hypothetical protein